MFVLCYVFVVNFVPVSNNLFSNFHTSDEIVRGCFNDEVRLAATKIVFFKTRDFVRKAFVSRELCCLAIFCAQQCLWSQTNVYGASFGIVNIIVGAWLQHGYIRLPPEHRVTVENDCKIIYVCQHSCTCIGSSIY